MTNAPVAIIDGGGANIASLRFALARLDRDSVLTTDPECINEASHVILPGVGAAEAAMRRLHETGLDRLIPNLLQPVLGICLGLQLFLDGSEEDDARCLGILPGTARRFPPAPGRPVPHMGWNRVYSVRPSPLLAGIDDGAHFYFVHSYALDTSDFTVATATYGRVFSAVVQQGNFWATQFHPERSSACGARLLENFLSL